ncbi:MAG: DegT/DnrJ/EryC1/StrS family aminotransferase [Desulfomonilia bacterium]
MQSNSRDEVMKRLSAEGIETRPFFHPMHSLPMYRSVSGENTYPVADRLSAQGMNLPSYAQLSTQDIEYVCDRLTGILSRG